MMHDFYYSKNISIIGQGDSKAGTGLVLYTAELLNKV